jgi:hypothetical protein
MALFERRLIDRGGSQKVYRRHLNYAFKSERYRWTVQKPARKKSDRVISLPLVLGAG